MQFFPTAKIIPTASITDSMADTPNEPRIGKVHQIVSPFHFVLIDTEGHLTKIEVASTPLKHYEHLLPQLALQPVQFSFLRVHKHPNLKDRFIKGVIELGAVAITSLYTDEQEKWTYSQEILPQSNAIVPVFVKKVECLRAELLILSTKTLITFYFSELKLVKLKNLHPKEMWEKSQEYFRREMEGQFMGLRVRGSQVYKTEMNIYGELLRRDTEDIKEKFVKDGYADLSPNATKYFAPEMITRYEQLAQEAKRGLKGMWRDYGGEIVKNVEGNKQEIIYSRWEKWTKEHLRIKDLRNDQQEIRMLMQQLRNLAKGKGQSAPRWEYNRLKIIIDLVLCLFEDSKLKKYVKSLEEGVKTISDMLMVYVAINISHNADNLDFLKLVSKAVIFLLFFVEDVSKSMPEQAKGRGIALPLPGMQYLDRNIKLLFRLSFLGNETFHDKLFGKRKEFNYEHFSFDATYLEGGISSSYSEYSDAEESKGSDRREKKVKVAQLKIRQNVTCLLSLIFKVYPALVETHWENCVTANILTGQFLQYLRQLELSPEQKQMTATQKHQIVSLMRSNFGDPCLVLLTVFQRNVRVRANSIQCFKNMMSNFESKKILATTQASYIEKLLKHTRSSFVPKSFIIFSGLRNALYFLLFSLHYQKNLNIILAIFEALQQICENCQLVQKMVFQDGVGLLLRNYIIPVLNFSWEIEELADLKITCVRFLSVLVSTKKKWDQIETLYFLQDSSSIWKDNQNINGRLLHVVASRIVLLKAKTPAEDPVIREILLYFTKLAQKYFTSLFTVVYNGESIWSYMAKVFEKCVDSCYSGFLEEIFKCHFDTLKVEEFSEAKKEEVGRVVTVSDFGRLLTRILPVYAADVSAKNYLHLLGILTYIDHSVWKEEQFAVPKRFLLHCFGSFVGMPSTEAEFPSLDPLQSNSLVRVALLKLVGYISFCQIFSSPQFLQQSLGVLLRMSKKHKSLNCVVKITWGLANWIKSEHFSEIKSTADECVEYLIAHAQSEKEKIASNCTRGIGFFLQHAYKEEKDLGTLKLCLKTILKNLSHPIVKVRTNTTKTLQLLLARFDGLQEEINFDVLPTIEQNLLKNNYNLQTETLQLLKQLRVQISKDRMSSLYGTMLRNLGNHTQMEYEFSEIKTIKNLRRKILEEIFTRDMSLNAVNKPLLKDVLHSMYAFLEDCWQSHRQVETHLLNHEFQKSDEALELVFNLKSTQKSQNNEQKLILTKGVTFTVEPYNEDFIKKVKRLSEQFVAVCQDEENREEWKILAQIDVQSGRVWIKHCAVPEEMGQDQLLE